MTLLAQSQATGCQRRTTQSAAQLPVRLLRPANRVVWTIGSDEVVHDATSIEGMYNGLKLRTRISSVFVNGLRSPYIDSGPIADCGVALRALFECRALLVCSAWEDREWACKDLRALNTEQS
jgi:hypothetical protein